MPMPMWYCGSSGLAFGLAWPVGKFAKDRSGFRKDRDVSLDRLANRSLTT